MTRTAVEEPQAGGSALADFGAAYRAHYDAMIRLAYVITDSMAAAEDIVQEAFVELYRRWPTVRDPESWLHTVVVKRYRWTANEEMVATVACGPAWCTGWTVGDQAAIQDLDGGGYIPLKEKGSLDPALEGRLAIGSLGGRDVVWDRGSGRAAVIEHTASTRNGFADDRYFYESADPRSPVRVWTAPDGTPTILDLRRLW
ncbi:sigma factor [Phytohabitans sp. ZYX-F-186]|uniref:Sigma factor n=1 Tax=Phytohabitans maris TaxID=3071409 RepID=A0ABU0ZBL8_9ACTN|nr:sigma factor [Phytohabitans sp. ZYX-F-186]MDQ7904456.1 sigma factor [Phytohabitans sp. ZYX-F-186]